MKNPGGIKTLAIVLAFAQLLCSCAIKYPVDSGKINEEGLKKEMVRLQSRNVKTSDKKKVAKPYPVKVITKGQLIYFINKVQYHPDNLVGVTFRGLKVTIPYSEVKELYFMVRGPGGSRGVESGVIGIIAIPVIVFVVIVIVAFNNFD